MSVPTPDSIETSPVGQLTASDNAGRVLVFIVAYEAERHIASVFDRVPKELYSDPRIHFLVIDDASGDQGASVARRWVEEHDVTNVTILRNPVNQGYGGNQKLGYRIGVDAGFDFVILLHGDGQYAPELLPKFIETWQQTNADVVLGSRMQDLRSAREGGMPWYKMIGNRTLTTIQNALTGLRLSEYHTGYRGYSTRFLRRVPFESNTNVFHFDTQILLQAVHVKAKIVEFAIPTHYGDEICRVDGMRYAKDVLASTAQFKMHQMGMLCALRYRNLEPMRYKDKTFMLYSSHALALETIAEEKPKTLLDIGCGPGFIARRCEQMGVRVTGLDAYPPLPDMMSAFKRVDLEVEEFPEDAFQYDMVLLLDVIEHLEDPEKFLIGLRNRSTTLEPGRKAPLMVISTPNIAFFALRLNLMLGRFNYAERGILDITHKRLFTRRALVQTIRDCGYTVERVRAAAVPFQTVVGGKFGWLAGKIAGFFARVWPTMFGFQFIVSCRPLPGVRQLLTQSEEYVMGAGQVEAALRLSPVVPQSSSTLAAASVTEIGR